MRFGLIFRVLLPWPTVHLISSAHATPSSEAGQGLGWFSLWTPQSMRHFVCEYLWTVDQWPSCFSVAFSNWSRKAGVSGQGVLQMTKWLFIFRGPSGLYNFLCRYVIALIIYLQGTMIRGGRSWIPRISHRHLPTKNFKFAEKEQQQQKGDREFSREFSRFTCACWVKHTQLQCEHQVLS